MKKYINRILWMLATILLVSFLVFLAFDIIPGDPAISILGTNASAESVEKLREEMGLNRPFMERYGNWLINCIKGDFGTSYSYNMPVKEMLSDKLPITLTMSFIAFFITIIFSIPITLFITKHMNSKIDHFISGVNQIMMSVPSFFIGIIITYVFGLLLKVFKPGGYVSYKVSIVGFIGYLIFPAIAIALPKIAMSVRLLSSTIADETKMNYVRTAYSRGNSTMKVLYRHVLKNALIPQITFWGMVFSDMIAGSIIIEQVFSIPGIGRILVTSISSRDYPVIISIIVIIAIIIIVTNYLVDILYRVIDPRTRKQV